MSLNVFVRKSRNTTFPITVVEYHTDTDNSFEHHDIFNYSEFVKELNQLLPNKRGRNDDYTSLAILNTGKIDVIDDPPK